jgi:3-deoxy-D-manno-octulosonate 8-phosphate phosphatase (KDO 8-P phosphatase)
MDTKAIRLVLFDVDGVLTDGTLYIGPEGEVFKAFNAKDGVAISLLKKHGIEVGIISGKASKALDFRIKQLGIDHAITGCSDKLSALYSLITKTKCTLDQIAFVGDDIIDIAVMKKVALSIAPVDAHPLAINAAHYISVAKGGKGVARESAEYILKNAGLSLEDMYADMVGQYDISQ